MAKVFGSGPGAFRAEIWTARGQAEKLFGGGSPEPGPGLVFPHSLQDLGKEFSFSEARTPLMVAALAAQCQGSR